ncbi:HWE histidine kinase domain-containing protein [Roseococcus sp. YIM B11640]|uniref:HWE histidine kinase domain-containing protein n=1 Tax=Roseococcus sp. YIM B11640 TaxID=3133973 RepID=UPI003C7DE3E6
MMSNVEDLYRLLRAGHVQAQGIVDTITDPMLVLDEALRVQNASRSFCETFKVDRDDTVGQRIFDLGNGQWDIPELRLLLSQVIPRSAAVVNFKVEQDFPGLGPRTMLLTARTLHHPDYASHSMLLVIVDATASAKREAAQDLLIGELRHRMRNLFALTQSIARRTTTEDRSAEEYRDAFLGRFRSLVAAQDLAFAQTETSVEALVHTILAPYGFGPEAISIQGAVNVLLPSKATMSLSLVFNELATNAAKYGCLSVPHGRVSVAWQVEDDGNTLRLTWTERGGPPIEAPVVKGYGSELIESAVRLGLEGEVQHRYETGGLEVEIVIPLESPSTSG